MANLPTVEWANLQYQINSDLKVRVGRMVLPTYEYSDTQYVGYSLPWVRIPIEIAYTDAGLHSDGLDVLYRVKTGNVTQNLQLQWGHTEVDLPGAQFTSTAASVLVFIDTLQYGDTSLRLAYQNYGSSGFPPVRLRVTGAGLTYDPGAWFVTVDSNHSQDNFFGDLFACYVSGGVDSADSRPMRSTQPRMHKLRVCRAQSPATITRNRRRTLGLCQEPRHSTTVAAGRPRQLGRPGFVARLGPGARIGEKSMY